MVSRESNLQFTIENKLQFTSRSIDEHRGLVGFYHSYNLKTAATFLATYTAIEPVFSNKTQLILAEIKLQMPNTWLPWENCTEGLAQATVHFRHS